MHSPGPCLVPGVERGSLLWCPLLLEGLKPTRKKGHCSFDWLLSRAGLWKEAEE